MDMKRLEDFSKEDLKQLRSEVVLNSIWYSDYTNSFGIKEKSVAYFFDGYYEYLCELAEEEMGSTTHEDVLKLDNLDNLYGWWNCFDDFSWVEYDEE